MTPCNEYITLCKVKVTYQAPDLEVATVSVERKAAWCVVALFVFSALACAVLIPAPGIRAAWGVWGLTRLGGFPGRAPNPSTFLLKRLFLFFCQCV